jgi:hypothetical protein
LHRRKSSTLSAMRRGPTPWCLTLLRHRCSWNGVGPSGV